MTRFGWKSLVAAVPLLACSSTKPGEQAPQGGTGGNTVSPGGQGGAGGTTQVPLPDVAQSALAYDATPSVDPATQAALVGDLNDFGLKVLQGLAPSDQNFVVSPVSGFIALTITSAGAQGATADEMEAVLYPDVPLDEIHPATNQLEQRIRSYEVSAADLSDDPRRVEVELANDNFVQRGFAIEPNFLDTLAMNYNCGIELVDYVNAPDAASALINDWVANETNHRIQNLLPPGSVDATTRLVLVDALYLYASWMRPFDPGLTQAQTFRGVSGDASTDFMQADLPLKYAASPGQGWMAVDVPYYGNSLVLTAVLPDSGQFDTVKATINAAWLTSFDDTSQSQQVGLSIPKFKLPGQTVEWKQILHDLGMIRLFDPSTCDLGGISGAGLFVSHVLQQVFIELTETGTEAAAATAVGGVLESEPPLATVSVVLDRPFLFFIRERGGPVLFAGQIVTLPAAN